MADANIPNPIDFSSSRDTTKDPNYPPRILHAEWMTVKDALWKKTGVFKSLALDMNIAQHYYFELKDTVGSKGRTFAEELAAYWNGQQYDPKVFTKLNDRITELEKSLLRNTFVGDQHFTQEHITALKALQKLGNDASHPTGLVLKDKPKVLEAMLLLARYVVRDFIVAPSRARGGCVSSVFDFDDVVLSLFENFKVTEATRDKLRKNEVFDSEDLETLTEAKLLAKLDFPPLIAEKFISRIIPAIPEYRRLAQQKKASLARELEYRGKIFY